MRAFFVLGAVGFAGLLAGCPSGDDGGSSSNFYTPGSEVPGCQSDSDCSGANSECARDGECLPPAEIHAIKVTWTVEGQPASDTSCGSTPDLFIQFDDNDPNDSFGYAPVACNAGEFPIDKMPTRYTQADLGVNGSNQLQSAAIDPSTGSASIDFVP